MYLPYVQLTSLHMKGSPWLSSSIFTCVYTGSDQTWRVVNFSYLHVPLGMTWRAVLMVRVYKRDLDEHTGPPPA